MISSPASGPRRRCRLWRVHRIGVCALALTAQLHASLADDSPFLPPGFSAPATTQATTPPPAPTRTPLASLLEFKGVYDLAGRSFFLVTERATQQSHWLSHGEAKEALKVNDFDNDFWRIHVDYQGQSGWLDLSEATAIGPSGPQRVVASRPAPTVRRTTPSRTQTRVIRPGRDTSRARMPRYSVSEMRERRRIEREERIQAIPESVRRRLANTTPTLPQQAQQELDMTDAPDFTKPPPPPPPEALGRPGFP